MNRVAIVVAASALVACGRGPTRPPPVVDVAPQPAATASAAPTPSALSCDDPAPELVAEEKRFTWMGFVADDAAVYGGGCAHAGGCLLRFHPFAGARASDVGYTFLHDDGLGPLALLSGAVAFVFGADQVCASPRPPTASVPMTPSCFGTSDHQLASFGDRLFWITPNGELVERAKGKNTILAGGARGLRVDSLRASDGEVIWIRDVEPRSEIGRWRASRGVDRVFEGELIVDVALVATTIVFADGSGRVAKIGAGDIVEELAHAAAGHVVDALAADATDVYWFDAAPLGPDKDAVCSTLERTPLAGGPTERLVAVRGRVDLFTLNKTHAIFAMHEDARGALAIRRTPKR